MSEPWSSIHLGSVASINRWSDTHVYSSGGGGYVGQHGGYVSAPDVHSRIDQRMELFSIEKSGAEGKFDFGFTGISFREGSNLFAAWGSENGDENGSFLYVENLDTSEIYAPEIALKTGGWGVFNGFGLGLLISSILFFASVTLMPLFPSSISYDQKAQDLQISKLLQDCPERKKTAKVRQYARYQTCEKGSMPAENLTNMTFWCECMSESSLRIFADSKKSAFISKQNSDKQVIFTGLSVLIGVLIWVFYGMNKTLRLRKIALALRSRFAAEIVAKANVVNVNLFIKNLNPLVFNRK